MPRRDHSDRDPSGKMMFDRDAWREGLEELDPAARAAMAAVAACKERPKLLDIDRMVAGLGASQETKEQAD